MNYPLNTLDQLRPILVGFRKSRQLTQAALADKLGITQQTYAQLEAKPSSASMERMFKVLQLLGVQLVLSDSAAAQDALRMTTTTLSSSLPIISVAESPIAYAVEVTARASNTLPASKSAAPKRTRGGTTKKESW